MLRVLLILMFYVVITNTMLDMTNLLTSVHRFSSVLGVRKKSIYTQNTTESQHYDYIELDNTSVPDHSHMELYLAANSDQKR